MGRCRNCRNLVISMERVVLEISYNNLKHNIDLIKKITNNKSIICIVKDNAYGLGGVNIAKFLSTDSNVKAFAVASFGFLTANSASDFVIFP